MITYSFNFLISNYKLQWAETWVDQYQNKFTFSIVPYFGIKLPPFSVACMANEHKLCKTCVFDIIDDLMDATVI